jgi:hypothetical protein
MDEKWMDEFRDRCFGGEKRGIEEVLLFQLMTNPQGMDINSILPLLLLGGGGIKSDKFALVLALVASQQQAQAQAAAGTSGVPVPPPNNMLMLLLLLGDRGGYRSAFRSRHDEEDDRVDVVTTKN